MLIKLELFKIRDSYTAEEYPEVWTSSHLISSCISAAIYIPYDEEHVKVMHREVAALFKK